MAQNGGQHAAQVADRLMSLGIRKIVSLNSPVLEVEDELFEQIHKDFIQVEFGPFALGVVKYSYENVDGVD